MHILRVLNLIVPPVQLGKNRRMESDIIYEGRKSGPPTTLACVAYELLLWAYVTAQTRRGSGAVRRQDGGDGGGIHIAQPLSSPSLDIFNAGNVLYRKLLPLEGNTEHAPRDPKKRKDYGSLRVMH